jgi:hypothetical protein
MLNNLIPQQNFENIRDAIGRVLTAEFAYQSNLEGGFDYGLNIYVERTAPIDKEELPVINIVYAESLDVDENTSFTSVYDNKYLIEIYSSGEADVNSPGDLKSALLNSHLMGMVRAILMNQKNLYLDFTDKFIQSRKVQTITRTQPRIANDSLNTISGTLEVHYVAEETTELQEGYLEALLSTVVKIENTEKGYKFII